MWKFSVTKCPKNNEICAAELCFHQVSNRGICEEWFHGCFCCSVSYREEDSSVESTSAGKKEKKSCRTSGS